MAAVIARIALLLAAALNAAGPNAAPRLVWSTFLGGTAVDDCDDIAARGHEVYLACYSESADFPRTRRAAKASAEMDAFIVKADTRRGRIAHVVQLKGAKYDGAFRIAIDVVGNVYATGITMSEDFQVTTNAAQRRYGGGDGDGFFVKIDPSGRIAYSTYLGGSRSDLTTGIAIAASGRAYVGGMTASPDLPGVNDGNRLHGKEDGFVSLIDTSGRNPLRSIYVGGGEAEKLTAIALDVNGEIFLTSYTFSKDFPVAAAIGKGWAERAMPSSRS